MSIQLSSDHLVTLLASVIAFLAALVAAGVSIYNARLTRFASERWWERKAEAYTNLVDGLVSTSRAARNLQILEPASPAGGVSEIRISELSKLATEVRALRDHIDRGAFLLDQGVISEIERFIDDCRSMLARDDHARIHTAVLARMPELIATVRKFGKRELRIKT